MHKAWGGRGLRLERAQVHRLWSVGWEARTCPSARPKCKTFLSLHVDSFERQRDEDHTAPVRRAGAGVGRGWGPTLSRHRKLMTHTFVKRVVALEGLACRFERRASQCWSKPGQPSKTAKTFRCIKDQPESVATPLHGIASLVVDRGAGTGLGSKLWSSLA